MAKPSVVPVLAIALLPAILGAAGREDRPPGPSSRVAPGTAPGPPAGPPWLGRYEENRGQAPPWVRYLVRTGGLAVALTDSGAVFALRGPRSWTMLRMGIEGAAPGGGFRTREPLPGRSHHLRGRDPARWVRGVPAFGRVERRGIRPGVDLVWRLEGSTPAYDLVVAPGADPGALVLRFEGASSLGMERDGTLAVGARCGVLRHGRPIAYQEAGGVRRGVPVAFEARGPARAGFRVGRHDPSLPLVIDPLISYASYFGGSGADPIRGLAPGPGGSILVAVEASSPDLAPDGSLDETAAGWDAFVARLAPGGARLEFATYLGGADDERTAGIALDASGGAWVSGTTKSADFPVWVPHQGTRRGVEDAFLLRLEPPGDALAFSTYFGGASGFGGSTAGTSSSGVAVLPGGGGVLVGTTSTVDLPVLAPFQESYGGWYTEGFVAAFSDEGVLAHSSFLGGSHYDGAEAVAVDADGAILVAGWTWSADFPQAGGVAGIRGPGTSAFVAKVPAGGGSLAWCQAFGGSGTDSATAVAALPSGDVCVAGSTDSADFPEVAPLGDGVGFLSIFSAAGDALELSTGLVGSPDAVAPDADGGLFLAGSTGGLSGFLVSPLQDALSGVRDAFLARIAPDRSGYTFSTYVGGTGTEDQAVLAVEDADHAWIAFQTTSQSMPVKSALQPAFGGGTAEPFLVRVTMAPGPPTGLTAVPLPGRKARLEWYDDSDDEAGFEIQRKTGAGAFATVASIPGERGSYEDPLLQPLTAYSYRVRALRIGGPSPWSDEAVVTTFDVAPFPPTGVVVAASSPGSLRVTWTPGSANQDAFEVHRRVPGGISFLRSVLPAGATEVEDGGLLPARTYGYVLRAVNEIGGADSPETWGTTAGTLAGTVTRGSLKGSGTARRDLLRIAGTLVMQAGSTDGTLDPITEGIALRLGGEAAPFYALDVPAASNGWTARRGRLTWKSPRGLPSRAILELDLPRGTFRLSASKLDFAVDPSPSVECWIASGNDAGGVVQEWEETRPGSGKFRFPPRNP